MLIMLIYVVFESSSAICIFLIENIYRFDESLQTIICTKSII